MQNFFPVSFFKTAHISTLFVSKKKNVCKQKMSAGIFEDTSTLMPGSLNIFVSLFFVKTTKTPKIGCKISFPCGPFLPVLPSSVKK